MEGDKDWTPAQDALCVWLCLSCPFSEFQKHQTALVGKTAKEIVDRFKVIMEDESLMQRVNAECNGDILSYKTVPWTNLETFNLIRLVHYNKKCVATGFLEKFPTLFHPTRTPSSVSSNYEKLRQKDQASIESQKTLFKGFQDKISEAVKGVEPAPFPGVDDPVRAVSQLISEENDDLKEKEEETKKMSFETITSKCNGKWPKNAFAALVGHGPIRWIKGTRIVFGRASPKCQPDIDLADLSLQSISRQHCAISIRTDLNFYLECIGAIVIVNGTVFKKGSVVRLHDRDVLDIGGAPFVFVENPTLMESLRNA